MLGVDLAAIELLGVARGGLQQILGVLAEPVLDVARAIGHGAAGDPSPAVVGGPYPAAIAAGPAAAGEGIATEELLEKAAAVPEQGLHWRG